MPHVLIVGAGPAGMLAAVTAAEAGADVTVLERNPYAGKKLRITGKGRCNVTNNCSPREVVEATTSNPKFLFGAVNRFGPSDVMAFFESAGVPLKTERGRRVFPASDRATDIRDAMVERMREAGVKVRYGVRVTGIEESEGTWTVRAVSNGERRTIGADRVILATGGVSYPATGSTGDGHRMLAKLGVRVTELKPSLVPIVTKEDFSPLSGLTLKNVRLTATHAADMVYAEMGEMMFTHFGVTGPLVLSASANMQRHAPEDYRLSVDLKPALSPEELDRRLASDFAKYAARDMVNASADLMPKSLIPFVLAQAGVDPREKAGSLTKEERSAIGGALSGFRITPIDFRPIEEAIITSGGADVREIDPRTMEVKAHPGLYVIGELLDVNAYTGGFNLQIAFSTAHAAGVAAAE
ncbi:MAG: NAD(P)/FAD-dependent oxidoreductase [Clostridiales bacterium]|nr:NAD(P)/FAD-dependent oxidoreductase [Clostridiales bacterium]